MVKNALREGEAYLLATQLHSGRVSFNQVAIDPSEDRYDSSPTAHVTAPTAGSSLDSEVTRMTEIVKKLMAVLAQSKLEVGAGLPHVLNVAVVGTSARSAL